MAAKPGELNHQEPNHFGLGPIGGDSFHQNFIVQVLEKNLKWECMTIGYIFNEDGHFYFYY